MNPVIDTLVNETERLCQEYNKGEGQLEVIYKLTSVVNRLTVEMREALDYTPFDGKVSGDDKNGREK